MNVGFRQYDHFTIILRIMKSEFAGVSKLKKNYPCNCLEELGKHIQNCDLNISLVGL